jgi:hypothetical protein
VDTDYIVISKTNAIDNVKRLFLYFCHAAFWATNVEKSGVCPTVIPKKAKQ